VADSVELKVDVEVLKTQVATITQLCTKMDNVIDKLVDNHDRMVNQIYTDMRTREEEKDNDVKELHSRINSVSKELSEKVELTERRIMDEIKAMRKDIADHNEKEDSELKKIWEFKWMAAGGIVAIAWLLSHVKLEALSKLF
jgi:formyltetrahydrofolate hydrolase